MNVTDQTQITDKTVIMVGTEMVMVNKVNPAGGGTQSWNVARGVGNTQSQYHGTGTTVKLLHPPTLLDIPTQQTEEPTFIYTTPSNTAL